MRLFSGQLGAQRRGAKALRPSRRIDALAEIPMPQADAGDIRRHIERVMVRGAQGRRHGWRSASQGSAKGRRAGGERYQVPSAESAARHHNPACANR